MGDKCNFFEISACWRTSGSSVVSYVLIFICTFLALATLTFFENCIKYLTIFQGALHHKVSFFYNKEPKTHNLDEG